jgi:hypothetical protein
MAQHLLSVEIVRLGIGFGAEECTETGMRARWIEQREGKKICHIHVTGIAKTGGQAPVDVGTTSCG